MMNFDRFPNLANPAMAGGMKRYLTDGKLPGGFLQAVLRNQLREAFERADDTNAHLIRDYVVWLYNEAPAGSWGASEFVDAWAEMGGLNGRHATP